MSDILKVTSPYDGHLIQEIPLNTEVDVEHTLKTAYDLFNDQSKWLAKHKRIAILENVIHLMSERTEELTKIAAEEGGKPYMDTLVEVNRAINGVKLAIEHLGQLKGTEIPMGLTPSSDNRIAFTMREPIGVVVSLSAFNHPLNLIVHQVIPAIAVGAPVIVKPASTTPLSCINFVKLVHEAGLPKEWLQFLTLKNDLSEKLATDSRVNYVSFIGSERVGWYIRSKLSPGTRIALEHGGVAPVILEPDADIKDTLPLLAKGGFYHAGQVCVSVQKIFAHSSIISKVSEELVILANKLKVGDPLDKETEVGPLISTKEVDRVDDWVKDAIEKGGKLLCGGKKLSDTTYAPTIILDPPDNATISKEEIFGPVIAIYSYNDRLEAIERANSLPYHFQASIFTKNIDIAMDSVKRINATAVMVNDHTAFRVDWMPFGGRDSSGIGMGGIPYSMHEMTRDKLMVIKSPLL